MPYRRGHVWWASVQVGGQRVARRAGSTRQSALDLEAELRATLKAGPTHGIAEALKRHIAGLAAGIPERTRGEPITREQRRVRNARERGRALWPHIADRELTREHVGDAVASVLADQGKRKIATVNRSLALLRRVLTLAYQWGWSREPLAPLVRSQPGEAPRETYLTREQVDALANAMPRCGDAVILAAYTGLRRGELLALRPSQIQAGAILVAASGTKTQRARRVPLPSRALQACHGLPWPWSEMTLRREWAAARAATGLAHIHWHDLRHTYASWLVSAGVPLFEVQQLLGHASPVMTQRYAHLAPSRLTQAVAVLDAATSAATVLRLAR